MRGWKALCAAMLFTVAAVCAVAQKVSVQYNKQANFQEYRTYSWMPHGATSRPFFALDIEGAVDNQLQERGLQKLENGGDLLVTTYGSLSEGVNVSYNHDIYAMPGLDGPVTWANGTPVPGNSTASYVDKGTLIVDLVDRRAKQLQWRGTAKAKVDPEQKEKSFEIVENAVAKMFKQYPSTK